MIFNKVGNLCLRFCVEIVFYEFIYWSCGYVVKLFVKFEFKKDKNIVSLVKYVVVI